MPPAPEPSARANYREWLTATGLAGATIRNYELRLNQALEWCYERNLSLAHLQPTQLAEMSLTFAPSSSTREQLRAALSHYYDMIGRDRPPLRAIRSPKKPTHRNRALSPEDTKTLLETARFWFPEGLAVGFGLYLGLRVSEVANAQWSRFNHDMSWYEVLGKGDETYDLPVNDRFRSELEVAQRLARSDWVFPGRFDGPVVPATVWKWVRAVSKEAGIGEIQSHVLRHTAITEVNDRTGNLRVAQEFARHKDPNTTKIYTRVTGQQLEDAVAKMYED